jgi:Pentapeptide repeats (9 copies)
VFSRAIFGWRADFSRVTFTGRVWFSQARFGYDAEFNDASFSGDSTFYGTTFGGLAEFQPVTFADDVMFSYDLRRLRLVQWGHLLLLDPTGHRMAGKWVGFGRDFDLNTCPWTLELVSSDTGKDALSQYNRHPGSASACPGVTGKR